MKLQKLVYCTHGWWLAVNDKSLLSERPQVWRHGPVFSTLYHVLKPFGHHPIERPQSPKPAETPVIPIGDNYLVEFTDWVWNRYGHLSGLALSQMTHQPGTAWSRLAAEHHYRVPSNLEIPDEYVREEFRDILLRESGDGAQASA